MKIGFYETSQSEIRSQWILVQVEMKKELEEVRKNAKKLES